MAQPTVWDYLVAIITLLALTIGGISVLVGKVSDWRERRADRAMRSRRRAPTPRRRARRPLPTRAIMSRAGRSVAPKKVAVGTAVTMPTAATAPIVTPNNEYSSGLSDSGRVQFEERAKTIATLYEAGLITNLSKAICKGYGCSVQAASKTDSTYQMALKAVNRYLPKKDGPQYPLMTPEMEANRDALGMNN